MRPAEACRLAAAAALALTQLSCIVLPVRTAPGVGGVVVDGASGRPLAGALVVVRFDGRRGRASIRLRARGASVRPAARLPPREGPRAPSRALNRIRPVADPSKSPHCDARGNDP